MAEREAKWRWAPDWEWRPLGTSDTQVPRWVTLDGQGHRGAPDLHVEFEIRDGVPEVTEFRLTAKPAEKGRGIRTADLRAFNSLDGLAYNAFVRVPDERLDDKHWAAPTSDEQRRRARKTDFDTAKTRRRRTGYTQEDLANVARIYKENIGSQPTTAVMNEMGLTYRTAARRVKQAEEAGLLPPTRVGRKRRDVGP